MPSERTTRGRVLRLPNSQIVSDEATIAQILAQRNSRVEKRRVISPADLLSGVDLSKAVLSKEERKPIGVLELPLGDNDIFPNHLYEIPDITIDMTPQSKFWPRTGSMNFSLITESRVVTIEALFDERSGEYLEHYGDDAKVKDIVTKNLLEALHKNAWQPSKGMVGWSVAN